MKLASSIARLAFCVVLGSTAVRAWQDPALAPAIVTEKNVVYATRDGEALAMDLAHPRKDERLRPGVLFLHGGGWAAGHRSMFWNLTQEAARRGYVAATASYRLVPNALWPAQGEDVSAAVTWLRANAARFGLDRERLAVAGASAGGHLALYVGLRADALQSIPPLCAIANWFGPTDLLEGGTNEMGWRIMERFLGSKRDERPDVWKQASPLSYVGSGDPPVLTLHGEADRLVPMEHATRLHAALAQHGVPGKLVTYPGQSHGFDEEHTRQAIEEMFRFFDLHMQPTEMPLVLADDFEGEEPAYQPTDPEAWTIAGEGALRRLALVEKKSSYQPKVRSPFHIALLGDVTVSSFVMDVRVRSTHEDYGHRDLCLFFGHRDPEHFYYVHLGKKADPHAHSIFLVDGAPRSSIAEERTEGTPWDDAWHLVRVVRDLEEGTIEVYWDDLSKPVMRAVDRTFGVGRIGVGSFDDIGEFDAVRVYGKS